MQRVIRFHYRSVGELLSDIGSRVTSGQFTKAEAKEKLLDLHELIGLAIDDDAVFLELGSKGSFREANPSTYLVRIGNMAENTLLLGYCENEKIHNN